MHQLFTALQGSHTTAVSNWNCMSSPLILSVPPRLKSSQLLQCLVWSYVHISHLHMMLHNPTLFARSSMQKAMWVPVSLRNTEKCCESVSCISYSHADHIGTPRDKHWGHCKCSSIKVPWFSLLSCLYFFFNCHVYGRIIFFTQITPFGFSMYN
jgi:hypothetical protein